MNDIRNQAEDGTARHRRGFLGEEGFVMRDAHRVESSQVVDPNYERHRVEMERQRAEMQQMRYREFRTTCLHVAVQTFGIEFGGNGEPVTAAAIVARASEFERFVMNGAA